MKTFVIFTFICLLFTLHSFAENKISSDNQQINKVFQIEFNNSSVEENAVIRLKLKNPQVLRYVSISISNQALSIEKPGITLTASDYLANQEVNLPLTITPKQGIRKYQGNIEFITEAVSSIASSDIIYSRNFKPVESSQIENIVIDIPRPTWQLISMYGGSFLIIIFVTLLIIDRKSRFKNGRFHVLESEGFTCGSKNIFLRNKKVIELPGNFLIVKKGTKGTPKFFSSKNNPRQPRIKVEIPNKGTGEIRLRGLPLEQSLNSMIGNNALTSLNGCVLDIQQDEKRLKIKYNKS